MDWTIRLIKVNDPVDSSSEMKWVSSTGFGLISSSSNHHEGNVVLSIQFRAACRALIQFTTIVAFFLPPVFPPSFYLFCPYRNHVCSQQNCAGIYGSDLIMESRKCSSYWVFWAWNNVINHALVRVTPDFLEKHHLLLSFPPHKT